jgi:hypothetical protein
MEELAVYQPIIQTGIQLHWVKPIDYLFSSFPFWVAIYKVCYLKLNTKKV